MANQKIKKRIIPRGSDPGTVLFTSLMLILLTFFILMNSMAVVDEVRSRLAVGSLLSEFGAASALDDGPGAQLELDLGDKPALRVKDLNQHFSKLLSKMHVDGDVKVYLRDNDLALMLPGYLIAEDDPTTVSAQGRAILQEMARLLSRSDRIVRVEGHEAGDPQRNEPDVERREWLHAMQRSMAASDALLQSGGIHESRLETAAYGSARPFASEDLPWLNSRVELVVVDGANDSRIRAYPFEVRIGNRTFRKVVDETGRERYVRDSVWR
ncbi:OmpA family protein [Candidatus Sumerlaeota bacterium]|nr:OmpA family protein [Candidatus Sumerlaeota bacterium]